MQPTKEEHTNEPWKFVQGNEFHGHYIEDSHSETITDLYVMLEEYQDDKFAEFNNSEANARRIVACVNACAGIKTSDLEAMRGTSILQNANHAHEELKQQNAEIVEAAKNLVKVKGRHNSELAMNRLIQAITKG